MNLKNTPPKLRQIFIKFVRRIYSWMYPPEKDLRLAMADLTEFKEKLKEAADMPDQVKAVVPFFSALSPFYQKKTIDKLANRLNAKNYQGQLDQVLLFLSDIQTRIVQCVRAYSGVYRVQVGEAVTDENIWLGGIHGVWSRPVAYWLEKKQELDNSKNFSNQEKIMPTATWLMINDNQSRRLTSFGKQIAQLIDELKNYCSKDLKLTIN